MISLLSHSRSLPRAALVVALLALGSGLGVGLGGCANMGDGMMASAFADPAKYEFFDCKQLEAERKILGTRGAELQGLMAKADTGVAGPVVAELAYRNDYISTRAQEKLADEAWRRNKCHETPPTATTAATAAPPPANDKPAHSHSRSGNAVY